MAKNTLKWLTLIAAIWLQCMSGTNFNFPAYSSQLKKRLSLSELQLNDLALASDAGKLFGWLSGIAAGYLPLWMVLLLGTCLGVIGYGVEYLLLANQISSLSYWQLFLLTSLAGNSICWINTVSYIIVIQNFPLHRQFAVGLSTSYQGLSAGVFTNIVNVMNHDIDLAETAKSYLLLNTVLPLMISLAAAPVVRNFNEDDDKDLTSGGLLLMMLIITILTGIFAVISSLSSSVFRLSPFLLLIGIGIFLLAPFTVPLVELLSEMWQNNKFYWLRNSKVCDCGVVGTEDFVSDNSNMVSEEEPAEKFEKQKLANKCGPPRPASVEEEEIGPIMMMKRSEFWLYYFVYLFGVTLGLVYMNNLGQIVESRGSSSTTSSALVSLSSSFAFFGRLFPSLLDYYVSRKNLNISRPGLIATMMVPVAGAFFLLVNSNIHALYISTAAICLCTGAITAIAVSTTAELFGAKNFGVNHNILVTNIPLGSLLFGDFAAWVYNKGSADRVDGSCIGSKCYQLSFLTWGFLCSLGIFLAILLHFKTRTLFSSHHKSIDLK